jgi:putative ABC transport system substrate-binding protein
MRRRDFIKVIGAATTWPLAAGAQATTPVIGYLTNFSAEAHQRFAKAFQQGLADAGFMDGRDVTIEYRLADVGQYDRLPSMAADLVSRRVNVLFACPINAAIAAKNATHTMPIVFAIGSDPVEMKLVASMSHPGGNATGATFLSVDLTAKRMEILRELVPKVASVALLVNPKNPTTAMQVKDMQAAAAALGLQLNVVNVDAQANVDIVYAALAEKHTDTVVVSADGMFWDLRDQIITSAARHSLPTMYFAREFAAAGGLVSYNSDYADSIRKAGTYTGRILKGEKSADLPVLQPTKFELVIDLKTAKALGLTISRDILLVADEVIE